VNKDEYILIVAVRFFETLYSLYEERRWCEDNHSEKKLTMMQQHPTEQRSIVDSRRRLTNFKMLVSHSVSAVLRQSV